MAVVVLGLLPMYWSLLAGRGQLVAVVVEAFFSQRYVHLTNLFFGIQVGPGRTLVWPPRAQRFLCAKPDIFIQDRTKSTHKRGGRCLENDDENGQAWRNYYFDFPPLNEITGDLDELLPVAEARVS